MVNFSRDLYGQARHGVIRINEPQYNSTLKSHPDAALRYLDEDDGETITIGSGFELRQRLEEPIPQHKAVVVGEHLTDELSIPQDLHIFDIQRSSNSIATWMDHEAYSSKVLQSFSPPTTGSVTDAPKEGDPTTCSTSQEPELAGVQEDTPPSELDMYEEMHDKEVQATSPTLTNHNLAQASPDSSVVASQQISDAGEKIVSNSLDGIASNLDAHLDTLADFLQNTSKALRIVAEKTRESDMSAVESILSGFNTIFGEVGKLAKAVLEPLDAAEIAPDANPAELDLQPSHEEPCEKKGKARAVASEDSELSASVEVVADRMASPSPVLATSPRPIARGETLPAQEPRTLSSHHRGTEITARVPMSQLDKLYHIPSKSFIANQPQEVSAEKDHIYATLERGGFNPDSDRTWKYMPLPDDDQAPKMKKKVDFTLPNGALRPRETAKSSSETFQRSILDLEASDPDFSARFPPLMSVRRVKTLASLRQGSQSPDNRMRSRQDALTRYPSLQQLERRKIPNHSIREKEKETEKSDDKPLSHMHRAWFDPLEVKPTEPSKEVEEVIAAVGRDIIEASNEVRRLPGAWPEVQADAKASQLPTTNESSGAFFNRMTGQGTRSDKRQRTSVEDPYLAEWQAFDLRSRHKPKHLERAKSMASFKPSATLTTPFDPLVSPVMASAAPGSHDKLKTQASEPRNEPETLAGAFSNSLGETFKDGSNYDAQTWYDNSLEASSPARSRTDGVRRTATEKMPHRRPYSHRYSGAGRLPWENFEDRSYDLRTGSFVQRQERARRAAARSVPPPPTIRQNPPHPIKLPNDLTSRVNEYRSGLRHRASVPSVGIAKQSRINECIQQLKDMGFGKEDANEASRLTVYAGASGGDIFEAVEMIEEDRKAADSFKGNKQIFGPDNGPGGWL
jgi:hypothetical protein